MLVPSPSYLQAPVKARPPGFTERPEFVLKDTALSLKVQEDRCDVKSLRVGAPSPEAARCRPP